MGVAYITQWVLGALIFAAFVSLTVLVIARTVTWVCDRVCAYVRNIKRRP